MAFAGNVNCIECKKHYKINGTQTYIFSFKFLSFDRMKTYNFSEKFCLRICDPFFKWKTTIYPSKRKKPPLRSGRFRLLHVSLHVLHFLNPSPQRAKAFEVGLDLILWANPLSPIWLSNSQTLHTCMSKLPNIKVFIFHFNVWTINFVSNK
jgi:hypothetical protein